MNAKQVFEMIMSAALRQLETTESGQTLIAAGFKKHALDLLHCSAANAAQPIAVEIEDLMEQALLGRTPTQG
jgi:hypothetical protein